MVEAIEKNFWKDIWPLIIKSPIALFSLLMTFLMGYGISFLLFDYRRNPKGLPHLLHIAIGTGYACLIFVFSNWALCFSKDVPLTLEDIARYSPGTMMLSFAILVIVMILVILFRERQRNKESR